MVSWMLCSSELTKMCPVDLFNIDRAGDHIQIIKFMIGGGRNGGTSHSFDHIRYSIGVPDHQNIPSCMVRKQVTDPRLRVCCRKLREGQAKVRSQRLRSLLGPNKLRDVKGMCAQVHRLFTAEQVKILFQEYCQGI
jgi:hypothetical protein